MGECHLSHHYVLACESDAWQRGQQNEGQTKVEDGLPDGPGIGKRVRQLFLADPGQVLWQCL